MIKKKFKIKAGFTIIETMIAVSLFIIIIMEGMGSLLNANLLHNKAQNLREIMDNMSFVLEDMSRSLRTGYNYHCFVSVSDIPATSNPLVSAPSSCPSGKGIAFESSLGNPLNNDDQWVYFINNGKIYKSTQGPYPQASFYQLTPDEVIIDPISSFSVLGAEPPSPPSLDTQQPFVIIRLVGTITYKGGSAPVVTPFSIQTSVSQRLIDI